jgi:prolyl-tRNA synthetase
VSTRLIGALIMAHSDDNGLVLPPKLAPIHAAFVPIYRKDEERDAVVGKCKELAAQLEKAGLSVVVDDREGIKPGMKYYHWERRGVPIRLEIGPRDLASGQAAAKRRVSEGGREFLPFDTLAEKLPGIMDEIQADLFKRALDRRTAATLNVDDWETFKATFPEGKSCYVKAHWCGTRECEAAIKEESGGVTTRCVPIDAPEEHGKCVRCGQPSTRRIIFARAY